MNHKFWAAAALSAVIFLGWRGMEQHAPAQEDKPVAEKPAASSAPAAEGSQSVVLGEGPDWTALTLADFTTVNGDPDTWIEKDGVLHCKGTPVGVTRSKKVYTNFELVVEWRHLKPAGNSGVFLWTVEDSLQDLAPGKLPHGVEVQVLDNGYAEQYEKRSGKKPDWFTTHGDVFPVGVTKLKPFPPTSPNGQRSFPKHNLCLSSPAWNQYYVRAVNGEVRLWVNGREVSGGTSITPCSGPLCLESEGSPVEFRRLRIRELP